MDTLLIIKTANGQLEVDSDGMELIFMGANPIVHNTPVSILKDALDFYISEKMETKATVISSRI